MDRKAKVLFAISALASLIFLLQPLAPMHAQTPDQQKLASSETVDSKPIIGAQEKPTFEVVAIKRVLGDNHFTECDFHPGGRFRAHCPLLLLIAKAYEVDIFQVSGIPSLIDRAVWDIQAKVDESALRSGFLDPHLGNQMIQSMLEDRFILRVHKETKMVQGYELVVVKGGPKIKLSKDQTKRGGVSFSASELNAKRCSVSDFSKVLTRIVRLNVAEKTGLKDLYDFTLAWTPERVGTPIASPDQPNTLRPNGPEVSIFDAIQDQLGLKLIGAKISTPIVVVDDVQMPSEN